MKYTVFSLANFLTIFLILISPIQVEAAGLFRQTPIPAISNEKMLSPVNIGKLNQVRRWGDGRIQQIAWSPDSKQIAILGTVYLRMYEAETANKIWEVETSSLQSGVIFSQNGDQLITYTRGGR